MKFRELTETEFSDYALKHKQNNFYQTVAWGQLKKKGNWKYYFVGITDEGNNIVGASLLLGKKLFSKYKMFYAPRGFLIDYSNYNLVSFFTSKIKEYLKSKNAIFIKIDPYVMYKERDIDGNVIEGGIDNSKVVKDLKKLGYNHTGFTVYQGNLQPRWLFVLDIENKTEEQILKEVHYQHTRHNINKTLKLAYNIKQIDITNIEEFKKIMEDTSKRRGFIDRPLSYYRNMFKVLDKYNMIKILLIEFNCDKSIEQVEKDNEIIAKKVVVIKEKYDKGRNQKNLLKQILELEKQLDSNVRRIDDYKKLKNEYGNNIIMSGAMFIIYGDEIIYLFSGTYDEFIKYHSPYRIQWEMIKYAIDNGYKRYNFYGISGAFDKDDPAYGVYAFKKGFNGRVVELIGEFDLVINKLYYYVYKVLFKVYNLYKKLRLKLNL